MGRQLTVSRRGEGAPIDAMLWLLEPDVRLVDSRSFTSLAEFTAWLRGASDVTGGLTLADVLGAMRSGNAYCNIHTVTFPGGEIRGQIRSVSLD